MSLHKSYQQAFHKVATEAKHALDRIEELITAYETKKEIEKETILQERDRAIDIMDADYQKLRISTNKRIEELERENENLTKLIAQALEALERECSLNAAEAHCCLDCKNCFVGQTIEAAKGE